LALVSWKLLVTDDGLRGFQDLHPLVIPWSSVQSISVDYKAARQVVWVAWVTLGNGERVPPEPTQGTREHVGRITAELTAAS
jgi:hypothetical protein